MILEERKKGEMKREKREGNGMEEEVIRNKWV